jgi:hypothetical protein
MYYGPVPCREREILTAAYLETIARNAEAGQTITDKQSEAWRRVTEATRRACQKALEALNEHRRDHES